MSKKNWLILAVVVVAAGVLLAIALTRDSSDGDTIKLGATFPLTGEVASYGQKAKRGIELAVEDINATGGVLGRKIEVDFQDDRHDKKEAVSIVTKFATVDKVPVIFGSAGSSVTLAVAPVANRNKVVLVSPISSSATLSTEGGHFFFRTVPADDLQAETLANWVYESGARNVAKVLDLSDRVYALKLGKVEYAGVSQNLAADQEKLRSIFL